MTEQALAEVAAPVATAPHSIIEILEAHAAEKAAPVEAPKPAAKPAPAGFIDPLDEANFQNLDTPEGIKAARELIQAQLSEAKAIRIKAHNARAEAERKETKFKGTKAEVLALKQSVAARESLLDSELAEIQSGDPARFTNAIARLAKKSDDPIGFWREVATHIATGNKPSQNLSPAEVKAQIAAELREEMRAERELEREQERGRAQEQDVDQRLMQLRVQQLEVAKTFGDLPYVSSLASEQPALVDARLVEVRTQHRERTGQTLDLRAACDIVEGEIRSHFELLQRAGNPRGAMNGEREAAAPVAGLARLPERNANPEPVTSSPAQNRSVTSIPASLSAAPGSANRARTTAEKRAAIEAGLSAMGVFENFGIRG